MGTRYVRSDIEATAIGAPGIELDSLSSGLTDVYVYSYVDVTSSYDDGIRGLGSSHDALIGGYIIGDANGVRLGDDRTDDRDQRVLIYSGGTVVGMNAAGVAIYGYNSVVNVKGEIQGDAYGVLMSGVSARFKSNLLNDGEIYSVNYGVAHSLLGGDTEGLILKNTGHIEGGLFSFYGGDNNIAADRIENSGKMIGDISLGGGNDVYVSRDGGSVEGVVYGGVGDDRFVGGSGVDEFVGGAGNDRLDGGRGYDILTGGLGDDTYVLNNTYYDTKPDPDAPSTSFGDTVIELSNEGIDTIQANFIIDLISYENVENFVFTAPKNGSVFYYLNGNKLSNTITGNDNDSWIDGREGADVLIGLGGNDTYIVDNVGDKAIEKIDGGIDTVRSSVSFSLIGQQIENLTLTGTDSTNATGNGLDNTIIANSGNNIINGGAGSDNITLGSGFADADTIIFSSALGLSNVDTVSGFQSGTDKFQLSSSIFSEIAKGTLSSAAFQSGSAAAAQNADIRVIYDTRFATLSYDSDGSGANEAVVFAKHYGIIAAGDFLIV